MAAIPRPANSGAGEKSQLTVLLTAKFRQSMDASIEKERLFQLGMPFAMKRQGPMVGLRTRLKKGFSNVRFVHPRDRHSVCRRFHFRASARFGRHVAADRLRPLD
jgi:hypothetical protein